MKIRVVIEAHGQVISSVGFSNRYRNGAYELGSEMELDEWLRGNPRIRMNRNDILYHLDYPGTLGYAGYVERVE